MHLHVHLQQAYYITNISNKIEMQYTFLPMIAS